MIFLLAQWRWILPTALLAMSLAWGGYNHMALTTLRAADAKALHKLTSQLELAMKRGTDT